MVQLYLNFLAGAWRGKMTTVHSDLFLRFTWIVKVCRQSFEKAVFPVANRHGASAVPSWPQLSAVLDFHSEQLVTVSHLHPLHDTCHNVLAFNRSLKTIWPREVYQRVSAPHRESIQ